MEQLMKKLWAQVKKIKSYIVRIGALFTLTALDSIGGASLLGKNAALGAALAGILAIVKVTRDLAQALLDDGKISQKEFNDALSDAETEADTKKKK